MKLKEKLFMKKIRGKAGLEMHRKMPLMRIQGEEGKNKTKSRENLRI